MSLVFACIAPHGFPIIPDLSDDAEGGLAEELLRRKPGQPLDIVAHIERPKGRLEFGGVRLPPTYANFYVGNGFVVVPGYGDANDERALEVLTPLFPGRAVIGLSSRALITGGGSFHCVTQQQPAGRVSHE